MENIRITKKQLMDYLKSKSVDAKKNIEYSEYANNLKNFLIFLKRGEIDSSTLENTLLFWKDNFNLNKTQLLRLLEKYEIIIKQEENYLIPAINIQRKVKRLYSYLIDKKENKGKSELIGEETGIGSVGGGSGFALDSPYIWKNNESIEFKDCVSPDSKNKCEEGGGKNSPIIIKK